MEIHTCRTGISSEAGVRGDVGVYNMVVTWSEMSMS